MRVMDGSPDVRRFGPFRLDTCQRVLRRGESIVGLPPKAIDTLIVLVQSAGEVVSRETLFQLVWRDTFVVESSLNKHISILRKALDNGRDGVSCIETVSKRGYRFTARFEEEMAQPVLRAPGKGILLRGAVAGALVLVMVLLSSPRRPAPVNDAGHEAERQYRAGRHVLGKLDRAEMRKALERFQKAVKLDPVSAQAHAGMADTYAMMTTLAIGSPSSNLANARKAANRAIELNSVLALPHASLGLVRVLADFDFVAAEREYRTALKLDADSIIALHGYACFLANSGRLIEARNVVQRAQRLDPVSPLIGVAAAKIEWYDHRFERAIEILRDVLELEPSYSAASYYMAMSLGMLGRTEEAIRYLKQARPHLSLLATDEAWLHAVMGDRHPAKALLAERRNLVVNKKAKATVMLLPAIDAGETDLAFWCIEEMWKTRETELIQLKASPRFDALHSDARFAGIVKRIWRN
jgi:DNA-binding winged helix-turn-helix (wHTH) protein/Tfp pilus assembly protein PilF